MSENRGPNGMNGVETRIREYILGRFPLARQHTPGDTESLLEGGIVDSLGILELVNYLTETFEVAVSDEDLTPENFNSIRSLAEFVARRAR